MKKDSRLLVISLMNILVFLAVSIFVVLKGITDHESWKVIFGSCYAAIFLSFAVFTIYSYFKNKQLVSKIQIFQIITFFSILIMNVNTIFNGLKHHDELLIVVGSIGVGLILIATIVKSNHIFKESI